VHGNNHLVSNAANEGMVRKASLLKAAFTLLYHHCLFTSALSVLLLIPPLSCSPILMVKIFCATQSLPVAYRGGGGGLGCLNPTRNSEYIGGVLDRMSKKDRRLDFLL